MHENAYFWFMSQHVLKRHNETLLMYHLEGINKGKIWLLYIANFIAKK
jgi:hypothetical protein